MSGRILVERVGALVTLTLDNPNKRNAVTPAMLLELAGLARSLAEDLSVRVLVLQGAGDAFCSGFDVSALPDVAAVSDEAADFPGADVLAVAAEALCACPQPVVAVVRGPCYGAGGELAICADFRVSDGSASFCMPPAKLGLVYSAEGLHRFARVLGVQTTRDLFYTARVVRCAEAHSMGLLDRVWQADDFADELSLFCTMLADNAPLSLRGTKKILQDFVAPATWSQLDPGQARGQIAQLRMHAFRSYDHAEGRAAFVSKRKPVFEGR